ncbi:RNA 3'-terminal phosphate cyclase [Galleria mellonella]|uniref:RNA 3'-terminal phosphate cyclase n=1 Tax=Galleria mellonella TaxID=7137 RepID=A0A6J3BZM5_GALME|nr:RNA 3'-terminal phosphate cyclase [Galleria mellonella]
MSEFLDIDGSVLEGGGQILRISISLSALLSVPVHVYNIRAGRRKPGLAAQHLKGIQLVGEMCQAKLKGVTIGSTEIEFSPGKIKGGHYMADTQTAGSISLLLQVALPCALMADGPVTLDLRGGTNADMAPQIDYMDMVFRPLLQKFGGDFSLKIHKRGYYPKGGGHVTVDVTPIKRLNSITLLDPGTLTNVEGISYVAGVLPLKMAYEMCDGVKQQLQSECEELNIQCYKEDRNVAPDNCSGIVVSCSLSGPGGASGRCTVGGSALGRRGTAPRDVGRQLGRQLAASLHGRACLDRYSQDQVILYMALAHGKSAVKTEELTLHTKTAIHVAELVAKTKFNVQSSDDHHVIECVGLGYTNRNLPAE